MNHVTVAESKEALTDRLPTLAHTRRSEPKFVVSQPQLPPAPVATGVPPAPAVVPPSGPQAPAPLPGAVIPSQVPVPPLPPSVPAPPAPVVAVAPARPTAPSSVRATVQGSLPLPIAQRMAHNGMDITKSDCHQGGSTQSGGHPSLRNPVNQLQALAFNAVFRQVHDNPGIEYHIHDFGAKYLANAKILKSALHPYTNWIYCPERPG